MTNEFVAALTFDDGPDPEFTPRLLDVLKQYRAKATFFMLGKAAERYPEVVRRAALEEHAIANHSWDHPSFPLIGRRARINQIVRCSEVLAPFEQRLFRPPYGHQTVTSKIDAAWLGYTVIGWNLVSQDWLDHDADWLADRVLKRIEPGSIINFHDALVHYIDERYIDRSPTVRGVELILQRLEDQYRFVTVPELLYRRRAVRELWFSNADVLFLSTLRGRQQRDCGQT
jgi:peptidoglycan/xylan/chitin deacetylase (PgdA/CDA1 family)